VQGARAVQKSIIKSFPNLDIGINIVWIKKLPGDSERTAKKAAESFTDHRVSHFYDQDQIAGKEIANSIRWDGHVAWDIYLFYNSGDEWNDSPPRPIHWIHQLKDSWAHKTHFRTGDDLVSELLNTITELLDGA
jgi:hypothetical protein